MQLRVSLLLSVIAVSAGVESANILGLFTSPSPSHLIVHSAVADALVQQGHQVTVITSVPLKHANPEVNHIVISPSDILLRNLNDAIYKMSSKNNFVNHLLSMYQTMKTITNFQYDVILSEQFQSVLNSQEFDLIVIGYFSNDFLLAVAAQAKAPVILVWSGPPGGFVNTYIGNPTESSYVPNIMTTADQPMTLWSRIREFLVNGALYGLEEFASYKFGQCYE